MMQDPVGLADGTGGKEASLERTLWSAACAETESLRGVATHNVLATAVLYMPTGF
jgi:hypothetical protein